MRFIASIFASSIMGWRCTPSNSNHLLNNQLDILPTIARKTGIIFLCDTHPSRIECIDAISIYRDFLSWVGTLNQGCTRNLSQCNADVGITLSPSDGGSQMIVAPRYVWLSFTVSKRSRMKARRHLVYSRHYWLEDWFILYLFVVDRWKGCGKWEGGGL